MGHTCDTVVMVTGPKWNFNIKIYELVVSTHLKNISQIGSFPQGGMKIKNL